MIGEINSIPPFEGATEESVLITQRDESPFLSESVIKGSFIHEGKFSTEL